MTLTDPLVILVILALLVVAAAAGYTVAEMRANQRAKPDPLEGLSFKEELLDLRYIKEQLDNPPMHHEHVWARKPDMHKMGWLRYRCTYKDCYAIDWRAEKVPVA